MLTLNQEIEILKNFSLKHKSLNSFYFGDEWETDSTITPTYPLMNAILQGSSLTNNIVSRKYLIIISDLVNKDESNESQVLSDCELMCYDLVNYLRSIANLGTLGAFNVSKDISLTDFTERGDSEVAGHFFELTTNNHIGNYSCDLPINAGNILDDNYIYVGGNTTPITSSFIVEIKDQDGNVIQTFTTSGEYMVNVLTGIQQVIGNTTTSIIQNIIN